jgi:hypothetical protein
LVFVVAEAETIAGWAAAEHEDEAEDDQPDDGDEFDGGEPELGLGRLVGGSEGEVGVLTSPKKDTAMMFSARTNTKKTVIHTPADVFGSQYEMMTAPTLASAATRMAYAYQ